MKRNGWKLMAIGGAATFLVLFGMEMSTKGIERIYGPFDGGISNLDENADRIDESETDKRIAALERELDEIRRIAGGEANTGNQGQFRLPGVPYEEEQAAVNKLADSTSGLLQSASSKGIRFVVSLFDGWMN